MNSIRICTRVLVMLGLVTLAGCHVPDSLAVHITRDQIQQQVAARFPIEKRELLTKAIFTDPVIHLNGTGNQVGIDAKARLEFTRDIAVGGRVSLAGVLEYDSASGQLFVRKIGLVDTHLDSVPAAITPFLQSLGGLKAIDGLFKDLCKAIPPRISDVKIGQLPDDWKGRAAKSAIRGVRINGDGLDIDIGLPR